MSQPLTLEEVQREAIALRRGCDAVMLSTVSPEGRPEASHAPCVLDGETVDSTTASQPRRNAMASR